MANTGFKGVDVRQTGNQLVFRALLQDATGALLATGTTTVRLYELQSDGTIKSYDFNDNTFKTTALTTATLAMTHRTGNNSTVNTGIWTAALSTLTGFSVGGVYFAEVNNTGASPTDQAREFQYGGGQGDLLVTQGSTGQGYLQDDVIKIGGVTQTGGDLYPAVTNIAVTSAALNTTAGSRTITSGSGSGGVSNTTAADGTYDNVADSAGAIDFYYEFDISSVVNGVGVGAQWLGYLVGAVNSVKVYAYNWGGSSWDQVGTVVGIAGAVNMVDDWELTSSHTGTGGNAGKVRIRFANTGLTGATVKTDRILLGYAITPSTLDAAGIRAAIGMASANMDTQLADIEDDADIIETRVTTALPSVAPNAAGGLLITAAGSLDIDEMNADIEAIQAKTDNLPSDPADASDIAALFGAIPAAVVAALDAAILEGTITHADAWRIMLAGDAGNTTGMDTATGHVRNIANDKDRLTATLDGNGNRTVTLIDGA